MYQQISTPYTLTEQRQQLIGQPEFNNLCKIITNKNFCFLPASKTYNLLSCVNNINLGDWEAFQQSWNRLDIDQYMGDGGTYRYRRYATYSTVPGRQIIRRENHQPHYQSVEYNGLNGGIMRHFAPIEDNIAESMIMSSILIFCHELFRKLASFNNWHIEVHQFRIDASQNIAHPTPEGIHRDGVNFIFMLMINRLNIVNGESNIYDLSKKRLANFTLMDPYDAAIVNDEQVMHGVSSIVQVDTTKKAYRDMLVVTFRKEDIK